MCLLFPVLVGAGVKTITNLRAAVAVLIVIDDSVATCPEWSELRGSVQQAQGRPLLHPALELFEAALRELVGLDPLLPADARLHDTAVPVIATAGVRST